MQEKTVRAGYRTDGVPTNINVIRSLKGALSRRIALRAPYQVQLREAQEELDKLLLFSDPSDPAVNRLQERIAHLKSRIEAIPFIGAGGRRGGGRGGRPRPAGRAGGGGRV